MRMWTFVWLGLKLTTRARAEELAEEELRKLREHLAVNPERRIQIADQGQAYFQRVPSAFLMVAALLAGFAGNLLASVLGHFVERPTWDLLSPEHVWWTALGLLAMGAVWYSLRLALSFYHYNVAMGSAYGIAVGGRLI